MNYKIKRILFLPKRIINEIVWSYQRITRGFSDRDWWSIDVFIAKVLSEALPKYVRDSKSISIHYIGLKEELTDEEWANAEAKRDKDYMKYADFFARYADSGIWNNSKDAKELNGVTPEEYKDAMRWLGKHFGNLWH
jgi:hypothetical protein